MKELSNKRKSFLCILLPLVFSACSSVTSPEPTWLCKEPAALLDQEISVEGFQIRLPKYYVQCQDIPGFPDYLIDDINRSNPHFFKDGTQPDSVISYSSPYPGSSQIVQATTQNVPRALVMVVKTCRTDNSHENLLQLYRAQLTTGNVVVPPIEKAPLEFGMVKGLHFGKGIWSGKIPAGQYFPATDVTCATNTFENVPAHGVCYLTIVDGKSVLFFGISPQSDSLNAIEQSILTFHK